MLHEIFEQGSVGNVSAKTSPTDLVSEADFKSQRLLREAIGEHRPEDGFVGEEEDGSNDHEGASGLRWVVDPLDGTVNYLFEIPQWCVSVAVEREGVVLAGAIYDPCRDELFSVRHDGPAELNGCQLEGPRGRPLEEAMVATGFYYQAEVRVAQAKVLERLLPAVRDIRRFGSAALDLAWIAAGRYDAYFERGIKLWDRAAGELLCRRVGLEVRELAPLLNEAGEEAAPGGILVCHPSIIGELESIVISSA